MTITMRFPRLLYSAESMTYEIFTVDKMWIKQVHARLFVQSASIKPRIAPVSVTTQI